ncbi:rRNA maturation RNAse YbeY [Candidatus Woesebacteria bacterium]|nr:rRNA maturation RNAse YbeY [Candidatus Woesebacteria bacterium]
MIHIVDSARFRVDRIFVKQTAQAYLEKVGVPKDADLNIIFVGKRKMLYIATVYKREPEALPVLSFSYVTPKKMIKQQIAIDGDALQLADAPLASTGILAPDDNLLGEIFICYPQAVLLAAERNKKVDDTLKSLIEHGINNLVSE